MNIFNKINFVNHFIGIMKETSNYNASQLKTMINAMYENYKAGLQSGLKPYDNNDDESVKMVNYIISQTGYSQDVVLEFLILLEMWAKEGKINTEYWNVPKNELKKTDPLDLFENISQGFSSFKNVSKVLIVGVGAFGIGYLLNNVRKFNFK